jgi:mannan endo-1,4-beta-mannosidase
MFWATSWISSSFVSEIGKTGANSVRILPQITAPTPDGAPVESLAGVEELIQLGIENHMLVDIAIDGGKSTDVYLRADVKALLLEYERNLVIHAQGESYAGSQDEWVAGSKAVIAKMRGAGYRAPLYIMTIDAGRNLPAILARGAEILASDPLQNVVFGWQAYWGSSNYYQNTYGMTLAAAMEAVRDSSLAIQVGLLRTTDPGETMNYSPVMADAESYQIGWLWWDWRMSTDDLTTDGTYGHWAANGLDVAVTNENSLANTSVRTPFQQSGTCD